MLDNLLYVKLFMTQYTRLIEQGSFKEAEGALSELKKKDSWHPVTNYLLGCLYDNYKNPGKSTEKARNAFALCVRSEKPIEDAFLQLAQLESARSQSVRILRGGLRHFPNSVPIFTRLLSWTVPDEREAIFQEMVKKAIVTPDAIMTMIQTRMDKGDFKAALPLIEQIRPDSEETHIFLGMLSAFCFLETHEVHTAVQAFSALIQEDLTKSLEHAPHFGLILCHFANNVAEKAFHVFAEIPAEGQFSCPFHYDYGPFLGLFVYASKALHSIIRSTKDKPIIAKARGIRGLLSCAEEWESGVPRSHVISDLEFANKHLPHNTKYCEQLSRLAVEDQDYFPAYRFMLQYLRNSYGENFDEILDEADGSFLEGVPDDIFDQIINEICGVLSAPGYRDVKIIVRTFLQPITNRLFKNKKYKRVADIADRVPVGELKACPALFELAYSYAEVPKPDVARALYEYYRQKEPSSSAAINNLGVIYEEDGDFPRAKEAFQKAREIEPKTELYKNNLKRIIEIEKAGARFVKEDSGVKKLVLSLWHQRDIDGYVPDVQGQLSAACGLSKGEAQAGFNSLTGKLYLLLVKETRHSYPGPTHRVNPYIQALLPGIEADLEREQGILSLAAEIRPDSLQRIGYDQELLAVLKRKSSQDVLFFLQRDLREAALALLTRSYKTTLVISGSMIETLLLDRISCAKITKYRMEDGKNKSVKRMDLNDFLYVARKEGMIDDQLYHLGHALRGFRNLIHPGIEQRKAAMAISEQNARIAWDIARKLIMEL